MHPSVCSSRWMSLASICAHDHIVGHAPAEPKRHLPLLAVALTTRRGAFAGAVLLAATFLPAHRLLDPTLTGLAGIATRQAAGVAWSGNLWGTVLVVAVALILARWLTRVDLLSAARPTARTLATVDGRRWAALCGAVAFTLSLGVSLWVLRGLPSSVDEMVQLLHARTVLAGHLALPLPHPAAAWMVQNSLLTEGQWASVYPPVHTLMLAVGLAVGAPWLVGPAMTGAGAAFVAAAFDRLLPSRTAMARVAALLCAFSPFLLFLGGSELSHTTAAAMAAMTLWCALRARDGSPWWAVLTGTAIGAFVATRPWTGIVVSVALLATIWLPAARRRGGRQGARWLAVRVAATVLGGLPFAGLFLGWNRALFGGPLTLGYTAAFGPAHDLGLHRDPWGNVYGLRQALAYTGVDLSLLGSLLLETPLPALAVVGGGLVVASDLGEGEGVLLAWAMAGVAANFVYWHHGIHMGPRFLLETGAAWVALWVAGLLHLGRAPGATRRPAAPEECAGHFVHRAVGWATALSLAVAPFLAVGRATAYRPDSAFAAAARLPTPPLEPALVFVHGSWSSRTVARLVATGIRRDSVETALRRNDACQVDRYARWRAGDRTTPPPTLDLRPEPGPAPGLRPVELSPGNRILVRPGASADAPCAREAQSDRLGTLELEPLLWQAPPLRGAKLVVARDLGPRTDARARSSFPGYHVYVAVAGGEKQEARLLSYPEAMALLWESGAAPGASTSMGRHQPTRGTGLKGMPAANGVR